MTAGRPDRVDQRLYDIESSKGTSALRSMGLF